MGVLRESIKSAVSAAVLLVAIPAGAVLAEEAGKPPAAPRSEADAASLVKQLGAKTFAEREAAEKELRQLGESARTELKAGSSSEDAEIRWRATRILEDLDAGGSAGSSVTPGRTLRPRIQRRAPPPPIVPSEDGRRLRPAPDPVREGPRSLEEQWKDEFGKRRGSVRVWGENLSEDDWQTLLDEVQQLKRGFGRPMQKDIRELESEARERARRLQERSPLRTTDPRRDDAQPWTVQLENAKEMNQLLDDLMRSVEDQLQDAFDGDDLWTSPFFDEERRQLRRDLPDRVGTRPDQLQPPTARSAPAEKARAEAAQTEASARLGVFLDPADDTLRAHLGIAPGQGVVVNRVLPRTAAERAGLETHDVILAIDGQPIMGGDDIRRILGDMTPGVSGKIEVVRRAKRIEVPFQRDH